MSYRNLRRSSGMSLIELMIAMLIGMVLILGVVQIFGASRSAYQLSEGMARTQENARFAVDYLQRDLRMAGHFGCVNDQARLQTPGALVPHFGAAPLDPLNFAVSIQGYEATGTKPGNAVTIGAPAAGWSPALPALIAGLQPLPGSDIVVLRYLDREGAPVNTINSAGANTTFTVPAARWAALTNDGVANPQLFGVADCSYADVFRATGVNSTAGEVTTDVAIDHFTPQPSGQTLLYRAESLVYYVASNTAGQPALFRARYNGANYVPEELVEGVESMQLIFGRDRTADLVNNPPSGYIDVYNPADALAANANEWRRVGAVQVGLVTRSPDRAAAAAPTLPENHVRALGVRFAPPATYDARYRASYETTVALRNRLYGN